MRLHFHTPQAASETQHLQHNKPSKSLNTNTCLWIVLIVILGFLFTKLPRGTGFTQMGVVFLMVTQKEILQGLELEQ